MDTTRDANTRLDAAQAADAGRAPGYGITAPVALSPTGATASMPATGQSAAPDAVRSSPATVDTPHAITGTLKSRRRQRRHAEALTTIRPAT